MADVGTDGGFRRALLLVVGVAALLRIGYVLAVTQHDEHLYDATYYHLQASSITDGDGFFLDPFALLADPDDRQPAADHAPLTTLLLLPGSVVDGDGGELLMRFTIATIGTATVAGLGLLGRRLAGGAAGIAAAGIAAIDPNLWMNDGLLMPEAPAVLLTTVAVGASLALRDRPGATRWCLVLGLAVGLAGLARAELLALGPVLLLPALLRLEGLRSRLRAVAVAGAAALAVVGPWVAFNLTRFEEPVLVSANVGIALRAANCDSTYAGPLLGYAEVFTPCTPPRNGREQSVYDVALRHEATAYIRANAGRLPVVVAARFGRAWNLYRLGGTAELAEGEGRPAWASWLGIVATWVLLPLAAYGAVLRRRAGEANWELLAPAVLVTAVLVTLSAGLVRYRSPGEPGLVLLAAIGVVALLRERRAERPHR